MAANRSNSSLEERKRILIERSDAYRQALAADMQPVTDSIAWVSRAAHLVRLASPLMILAAPAIGWWLRRRRPREMAAAAPRTKSSSGLFSKAWRGLQMFQQVWPVVQGFRRVRFGP